MSTTTSATEVETAKTEAAACSLEDDLDFADVKLGERPAEVCTLGEACESCQ